MSNKSNVPKRPSGPRVRRHGWSRRDFLKVSGAAGIAGAASGLPLSAVMNPARAAGRFEGETLVFASWGGSYQNAQERYYCDPFSEKTGATVIQDGPMGNARLRTMIESGSPEWDVVDVTIEFLYDASQDGMFEPIDTDMVSIDRVDPKYVHEYGVGCIVWSYNIGYNTNAFAEGEQPKTWADVFDVERFPGTRTFRDRVMPMLEIALMADGVPMSELYPLDVDRAFAKLDTIKDHVILWETNSQSQQLFVDGEVSCGVILNGRAYDAAKKGGPVAIEWDGHIQSVDYLIVPRGSSNYDVAMGLIDEMTVAENQAGLANDIAYSPTNPDAFEFVDPGISPWLATDPENMEKGIIIDADWWQGRLSELAERWEEWKLS